MNRPQKHDLQPRLAAARPAGCTDDGAAQDTRARFEHMVSQVPGMVFQLRRAGGRLDFLYASDGCAALTGLTPHDLTADGERLTRLVHAEDRAGFLDSLDAAERRAAAWNWQGRILVPSQGLEKWINVRATAQQWRGAPLWGGIALNITQAKRTEEELRRSQEMLREFAAHHESVREEERVRIARDVHDELGQTLTALKLQLSMFERHASQEDAAAARARVAGMKDAVDDAIVWVRNVASSLHPKALDLGIVTAAEWLVEDFRRRAGSHAELHLPRDPRLELDDSRSIVLFRILQESLTNISRHAAARRVTVDLDWDETAVRLTVSDDGAGFDAAAAGRRKSFGLLGMRERALMLGGQVAVHSAPGAGTTVSLSIPRRAAG